MKVKELIDILGEFEGNMEVRIGMKQTYGTDLAMEIGSIEKHTIIAFYGEDYMAVVITEDRQCGSVDYDSEEDCDDCEPYDVDDDMGFDPYEGFYTYDC